MKKKELTILKLLPKSEILNFENNRIIFDISNLIFLPKLIGQLTIQSYPNVIFDYFIPLFFDYLSFCFSIY